MSIWRIYERVSTADSSRRKIISKLEGRSAAIIHSEDQKELKRVKNIFLNYEIPLIYTLLDSQKKRGIKGEEIYLKK